MTEHVPLTTVLTFCALIVSAAVGLLGLRITGGSKNIAELQAVYQLRTEALNKALEDCKADLRRHQQHVDECENQLTILRERVMRLERNL